MFRTQANNVNARQDILIPVDVLSSIKDPTEPERTDDSSSHNARCAYIFSILGPSLVCDGWTD